MKDIFQQQVFWLILFLLGTYHLCIAQPASISLLPPVNRIIAQRGDIINTSFCDPNVKILPSSWQDCPALPEITASITFFDREDIDKYDCIEERDGQYVRTLYLTPAMYATWDVAKIKEEQKSFLDTLQSPCHFENEGQMKAAYIWAMEQKMTDAPPCMSNSRLEYEESFAATRPTNCDVLLALKKKQPASPCDQGNCLPNPLERHLLIENWIRYGTINLKEVLQQAFFKDKQVQVSLIDQKGLYRNIKIIDNSRIKVKRFKNPDLRSRLFRQQMVTHLTLKIKLTTNGQLSETLYVPLDKQRPIRQLIH